MRVAVLDDYQGVALDSADWGPVRERAEVRVFRDHQADEDAVAARLEPFEVVVAMRERTPFPASLLRRLPRLRLLVTTGMRNASIDVAAARELGVTVCGTAGSAAATPELTWGLLLSLARGIPDEVASVRDGGWQRGVGFELEGAALGILGLGRIGKRVAGYARAFGMDVLAWSTNLTPEDAAAHGARYVGKDELFAASDAVTVHLQLSDRTRGLVGRPELELLGPRGYLVNTSRGPIVDEDELVAALRDGRIAGAALDVFDTEPLPAAHPLRTLPTALVTPHIGYVSRGTYATFYGEAVADIAAWLDGAPLREVQG
ncbi:MAG TPA: D-2-hydroxyacid dehydrogenase family protein [Streptosporangiaceae bacterium]